ncbi:MAG TPA: protein phosphatase 2C domain-containing protein [Longimicrobiaceae bacterium]
MTVIAREPVPLYGLRFEVAAVSEQGPRTENQDAFSIDTFPETGILAVADGMGGERSGRLAADTALEAVIGGDPIRSLDDARRMARRADATVAQAAERRPDAHGGMGCALGFLSLVTGSGDGTGWIGAHVGDVRILSRSPDGTLRLETRDHTPAFAKWEAGEISLDEIPDTSGANRLQRAVGRGGEADVVWLPARPGWAWLIISDGVYKAMRLDELSQAMEEPTARAAVEAIRVKVLERGPDDNFTAVLVRALADSAPTPILHDRTLPMAAPNPSAPPPPRHAAGSSSAALGVAILALLAAFAALWMFWQGQNSAVDRMEEVSRLRAEVDSLAAAVQTLREPFEPTLGEPGPDSLLTPPTSQDTTTP